jgi:predicted XRE-type DNA-binding protein
MTSTIFTGSLHRVQRGHGKGFASAPAAPQGPVHRPARVAFMLALAHKVRQVIEHGQVRDQAEVARRLGFTRARITHLVNLTFLAPDLQERVLALQAVDGNEPMSERDLRKLALVRSWQDQRKAWPLPSSSPAEP